GSGATTTIGMAPPDQAMSTSRRTRGWPSTSASADSTLAARITAATVTLGMLAAEGGTIRRPMSELARSTLARAEPGDAGAETVARDDLRNVAIVAHVDHG